MPFEAKSRTFPASNVYILLTKEFNFLNFFLYSLFSQEFPRHYMVKVPLPKQVTETLER